MESTWKVKLAMRVVGVILSPFSLIVWTDGPMVPTYSKVSSWLIVRACRIAS